MGILFHPALSESLHIHVPSLPPASSVTLLFNAQIPSHIMDDLNTRGGQLQLWSNIPAEGMMPGQWGELTFRGPEASSGDRLSTSAGRSRVISLLHESAECSISKDAHPHLSLSLEALVRLPTVCDGHSRISRFSFTYRVVYRSGEIEWLGMFGENGSITFEYGTPSPSGISLSEGWKVDDNDQKGSFELSTSSGLLFARLDQPTAYRTWEVGKKEHGCFLPGQNNASILILVPVVRSHTAPMPHSYAFIASPDVSIALNSSGEMTASGDGKVLLYTCSSGNPDQFVNQLLSEAGIPGLYRCLPCTGPQNGSRHVLLVAPMEKDMVHGVIIPFGGSLDSVEIGVNIEALSDLCPSYSEGFSIFSPTSLDIQFFKTKGESSGKTVHFVVDGTGGMFLLSPVYKLGVEALEISVLTSHSIASHPSRSMGESVTLPTPPPSPRIKTPTYTYSSLPSVLASELETPVSPEVGEASELSPETIKHESSALQMTHIRQPTATALALLYFRYIFSIAGFFFHVLYRLFLGPTREVEDSDDETENISQGGNVSTNDKETTISTSLPKNEKELHLSASSPQRDEQEHVSSNEPQIQHDLNTASTVSRTHEPLYALFEGANAKRIMLGIKTTANEAGMQYSEDDIIKAVKINTKLAEASIHKVYSRDGGFVYMLESEDSKRDWVSLSLGC